MLKFTMSDQGGSDRGMFALGIALSDYSSRHFHKNMMIPDSGFDFSGPEGFVKIRYATDKDSYNFHEIEIRSDDPENERRLAGELKQIYEKHNFQKVRTVS